ncbi:uncharacterized protein LOC134396688 isoform X2 [Elgaria multicarinata webbii]|uniref:uncharacterized protein LOC134396688 isoform X2 n=1 Tax=Elgaria multicarinata webbii TaxID=159646 RepID=UPI002FCCC1FF
MAFLHFLTLCFLILMTSLEKLMGDKCVYEEDTATDDFRCKAGKQKAETMQLKHCPDVTGPDMVRFQCKVVVISEHGKNISIEWKNDNDIKEVTLQSCFANGSNCSVTTHINIRSGETAVVNGRISLNIIHNSFTLNINEVQIADQKEYMGRLYFEKGEGIMVIDLKVVALYPDLPIAMQNGTVGCTTSGGHLSSQVQETSETPKSKHVSVKNESGSFNISTLQYLASDLIYCCTLNNTISSDTVRIASENTTSLKMISDNIMKNSSIGIVMIILVLAAVIAVVLYRRKKTGVWQSCPIAYIKVAFTQDLSQLQRTNSTDDDV